MCSVFAESEVISLIADNREKADIAWGVCRSIANKSYSLLKRVGEILAENGFLIENIDSTVIAQRPKLLPYGRG